MIIHFNLDDESCLLGADLEVTPAEFLLIKNALNDYFNDTRNNWINRKMVWSLLLDYERATVKDKSMSEYIKREDAIVAVEKFGGRLNDEVLYEMKSALFTLPTADVVEVVSCKDCMYWNDAGLCKKHSSPIVGAIYGTDADDYCSEGKRKEQENEYSD